MDQTSYDYIVVGAGSAGCALVERLTRDGRTRVLLLEAGGSDRQFWIKVPIGYGVNFANPRLNWNYHAEPDAGLNGRVIYWPRGKVIGGSSSINAMAYMRGLPHDFDDWERAGAEGWSWQAVRPVYERMERHLERDADGRPRQRGEGLLPVSDLSDQMDPFSERFLAAAEACGWACCTDLSTVTGEGVGYYRSTVRHGLRCSAADAFLAPARRRGNLRVVTRATVEQVTFDGRRATGLRFRTGGDVLDVRAGREVILCAGAINSPKLLQLSGIGPPALLRRHGIPVLHDLGEVGRGLQDHLAISHVFRATAPTLNNILGRMRPRLFAGLRYVATRRGPLGVPVNQVGGYLRSDPACAEPDMQIYCNPLSYGSAADGRPVPDREPGYLLSAQLCRPDSRGDIAIRSADPKDAPLIRPNSLATEHDRAGARRALRIIDRLAAAPALAGVTRERLAPDPGLTDPNALMEDFRARASTVFHPTSTCRMGRGPGDSVLDARLRVHGLSGLRVVDSSAFPNVTSGNTNAPTMMLATRAADMILEDAATRDHERVLIHAP
ncbi:GMC family oxidoreductase [Oceanibacterium hippocampi]|uniref:Alcohol dehydrogenase [acceptor] n=1 Tax=Oceanibacterium hippocampi TaxID=745714 RepID=A0A1Y5TR75_9PROT|nr:GMC family oxidoreductase N-terminal domain-containing protein [Oceanibacterium hippocampi]SLN66340.1 Alcohol dehydrogenase [acceptor] [Oceanibacterium hippocampi]